MYVGGGIRAGSPSNRLQIALEDRRRSSFSLELTRLKLAEGDRLVVTVDDEAYPVTEEQQATSGDALPVYVANVPSRIPARFGVELHRDEAADATTGYIDLLHQLSLDLPADGAVFGADEVVTGRWSLNGAAPTHLLTHISSRPYLDLTRG